MHLTASHSRGKIQLVRSSSGVALRCLRKANGKETLRSARIRFPFEDYDFPFVFCICLFVAKEVLAYLPSLACLCFEKERALNAG